MSAANGKTRPKPAKVEAAAEDPQAWMERARAWLRSGVALFWRRLGFGEVTPAHWPKDRRYAAKYLVSSAKVRLTWPERLRVLASGRLHLAVSTKTRPAVERSVSVWAFSILPPGDREPDA